MGVEGQQMKDLLVGVCPIECDMNLQWSTAARA
jgi:hypothetical protein